MSNEEEVIKVVKKVIDAKENINKEINNIIETIIKESSIDYDRYLNYVIAAKNKDNKYD